jgi:hypothetical protein
MVTSADAGCVYIRVIEIGCRGGSSYAKLSQPPSQNKQAGLQRDRRSRTRLIMFHYR